MAAKGRVCIRADGSPEIGLGHLVRCMALADMLVGSFEIAFISKKIPETIKAQLKEKGFLVKVISSEEDFFTILSGEEIVVLDHYGLDSTYQKRIKSIGCKLVCIDDLHENLFFADLIINHSPGILPQDYQAQEYTKFALGPKYALLRPAFIEAAGLEREESDVKNIMICFGGSDFKNLTHSVLQVVQRMEQISKITVILGAAYIHRESIDAIAKSNPTIRVLSSLDEEGMLSEIRTADLAIIPSSGILYEVIAGGCVPLICYYADNQKKFFDYFKQKEKVLSFDAANFSGEDLEIIVTNILNKKTKMENVPFRKDISESSSNNLSKFKELRNG